MNSVTLRASSANYAEKMMKKRTNLPIKKVDTLEKSTSTQFGLYRVWFGD